MSIALVPIITDAGLAAAFRADRTGLAAEITHIGIGSVGYNPSPEDTTLRNEVARFPIADAEMASPTQAHMTALDDTDRQYWVRSVGFYLSDGTLFAAYSNPTQPLAFKVAGNTYLHAYYLQLTAVPVGSVIVRSTGANLSLYFAEQFASLAAANISQIHTSFLQAEQIASLRLERARQDDMLSRLNSKIDFLNDRAELQLVAIAQVAASVINIQNSNV